MKSPAFQFYAAEFLVDENVVLMTNREVGCYIKLMAYCWREGSIPSDVAKLARLCGEDGNAMVELWQNISVCFGFVESDPSRLIHPRLEAEREKQENHRNARAAAGKKGAEAKWAKDRKEDGNAMNLPMAKDGSSSSSSVNSSSKSKRQREERFDAQAHLVSLGVAPAVARDWLTLRSGKRLKPTETAFSGVFQEAQKAGMSMNDALLLCCKRGWGGFESSWVEQAQGAPPQKPKSDQWFVSPQAMSAKARELGIADARPGESETQFKARIQYALSQKEVA